MPVDNDISLRAIAAVTLMRDDIERYVNGAGDPSVSFEELAAMGLELHKRFPQLVPADGLVTFDLYNVLQEALEATDND